MSRSKARAGFSLLELVVALGIVAITSGVVMTHWTAPNQERQQLEQDAQRLASSIRYAQQMTVQGSPTQVRITTNDVGIYIPVNANSNFFRSRERWRFADGIEMYYTNARDFRFEFTARGTTRHGGATTRLSSPNYRTYLTTTVSGGRVNIGAITPR